MSEATTMKFDAYQILQKDLHTQRPDSLTYAILGLAGETGEVVEEYKKAMRDMRPEDIVGDGWTRERLVDELGDVLWYLSKIADLLEVPLSAVAAKNIAKLERREKHGKEPT